MQELRTYLAERLPKYMLPSIFVPLTELPLTPNRKVDRNALPIPGSNHSAGESYISPRTGLESKLSEIVAKLLGLETVGAGDNFFLLGGQSLFCTQLSARIRSYFGIELPVRSIFESPTPAQLAQQIESLIAPKIGAMNADEVEHALNEAAFVGGQK
jgi:acyl carrier protein